MAEQNVPAVPPQPLQKFAFLVKSSTAQMRGDIVQTVQTNFALNGFKQKSDAKPVKTGNLSNTAIDVLGIPPNIRNFLKRTETITIGQLFEGRTLNDGVLTVGGLMDDLATSLAELTFVQGNCYLSSDVENCTSMVLILFDHNDNQKRIMDACKFDEY